MQSLTTAEIKLLMDCIDHQESCYIAKREQVLESARSFDADAMFGSLPLPDEIRSKMTDGISGKVKAFTAEIETEKEQLTLLKAKLIAMKSAALADEVEIALGSDVL